MSAIEHSAATVKAELTAKGAAVTDAADELVTSSAAG